MGTIIPFFVARHSETYRRIQDMLHRLENELLNLKIQESKLCQRKLELERWRDKLEAQAVETLLKDP